MSDPIARRDFEAAVAWAVEVLADPNAVVLDTETTSLDGFLVELAVVGMDGTILFDSLIDPGTPIPDQATRIHGIADADVSGKPRFGDVFRQLDALLRGRRVLIYNVGFDTKILKHELKRGFVANRGLDVGAAHAAAERWMRDWARWECVMEPYSVFEGDWSDYHQNYRWKPLNGGHRALSDCRAVLARLKEMAGYAKRGERR